MAPKEKKEKKGKGKGKKDEGDEVAEVLGDLSLAGPWECQECMQENEAEDSECCACEEPRPKAEGAGGGDGDDKYAGLAVGEVLEAEPVAGKDKLLELKVDVGAGGTPLTIVTNAPNVKVGVRVVVATVGATVEIKGEEVAVKKASVGGVVSEGMLCDSPMLNWTGGGAGTAALVPASFALGSKPPTSRPRMDGN